jgi:hypothetical protein
VKPRSATPTPNHRVQITSPRSIKFLAIIREFDGMMANMDASGSHASSRHQYARGVYEWKRRFFALPARSDKSPPVRFWLRAGKNQ